MLFSKLVSKLKIVAGQVSLSLTEPSEQTISVLSVFIVDIYNSTYQQNDIALLKVIYFKCINNRLYSIMRNSFQ